MRTPVAARVPGRRPVSGILALLILFTAWMWVSSLWALDMDLHLEGCVLFTKYVVLVFLIERLVATESALTLFAWAHVGGCFLWAWLGYTSGMGGRLELNVGPGVADSNTLGLHLVTGLAFGGIMLVGLSGRRRLLLLLMVPFILNGVILTASRGAMLALAAAGLSVLAFAPRMRRSTVYAGALLGILLFARLAQSDVFWERMSTLLQIENVQQLDPSAEHRFEIAQANWKMFLDHPMGVGFKGNAILSPQYVRQDLLTRGQRSAHNTFLAVLIDEGLPGLLIFLAMLWWAAIRIFCQKRLDREGLPASLGVYRAAVAGGLAAYAVAGFFSNYVTAEVVIWLLALVSVLDGLTAAAMARVARPAASPEPAPIQALAALPVARWAALHPGQ